MSDPKGIQPVSIATSTSLVGVVPMQQSSSKLYAIVRLSLVNLSDGDFLKYKASGNVWVARASGDAV